MKRKRLHPPLRCDVHPRDILPGLALVRRHDDTNAANGTRLGDEFVSVLFKTPFAPRLAPVMVVWTRHHQIRF